MSKTVYFNFQDGNGWQDCSHLVRDDLVIIRRAFSDDFRFANSAVSFTVNYDPTLFADLLAPTKDVLVRVKDGATYLFTGYIPPTMERVYDGYYKTMQLKIEAIDYTDFLKEAVGDISYEDKKIMDPSDTANSLVHLIFGLIDLDSSYIDSSKSITTTVEAVTSLSENETALTILSDLLYEHGYAVNWNEEGKFSPLQWNKSAGSSPTHTFDDNNIVEKIKKEDKDNRLYFGVNIKWYEIGEKDNVLLYRADTPYDEDTNLFLGYTILNGYYYPVEANVDDPITGQKQVVYQEYTDRGIKYLTNPVIEGELDFNPEAFESDFSEILITKNHSLDINYDGYPGTDIITVEEYYNKKARILLYNDTGSNIDLYYLNIYGTVVYKTSERESKIRLSSVARRGVNTENLLKYTARFLFTSSKAESLAKGLAKNIEKGNRYYFFSSEDEVAVGDLVTIDTEYEDDTAIIIERIYDEQTEVYSYYAKRYDVSYSSLSELRQRLLHSLPPDPIKMVQIVPPYENIQTAIDILAANSNGGTIYLTAGDYYLTSTLIQKSNVVIKGRGDRTIIHGQTGSDDVIRMEDSNVTGASIEDVKIVNDEAEEYIKYLVNFNGAVSCRLKSCSLDFTKCLGVRLSGDSGGVINNKLLGGKIKDIWQKGTKATFDSGTVYSVSIIALSSTKIAIAYRDVANSNYGAAVIGSISDTTITFGSEYVFNSAQTDEVAITALSSTKIAIAYRDYGNSSYGTAIIGDVSGTVITFGSEYVFNAEKTSYIPITVLSSTKIAIAYQDVNNSYYGTVKYGYLIDETTLIFSEKYIFNKASTSYLDITFLEQDNIILAYNSGTAGKAQVVTGGEESIPILIDGDDNIFHGNQILAIDDYLYTQLVSVLVQGKRNSIVNNVINGLDEQQKKIKYGIITTDTSKDNLIANNSVSNVEKCAIMNSGDRNTIGGNKCVDNGEFIDRWDCEEEVPPMVRDEVSPHTVNCTWERSDEQAYEGNYSWKMTVTTGGSAAYVYFIDTSPDTTDMHGLLNGKMYKMSIRVYVPSSGGPLTNEIDLQIQEYYGGAWHNLVNLTPSVQDAWELLVSSEFIINSSSTGILLRLRISDSASSGEYIYIDDIHCQIIGEHNEYEHQFQDYGTNTQLG